MIFIGSITQRRDGCRVKYKTMGYLEDDLGNKSMMRRIVWMLSIATVIWMAIELLANVILSVMGIAYQIHTSYILTMVTIVLGGKVSQKAVEMFQKPKKKDINENLG